MKRIKKKEGENLTDSNVKRVIGLLNASPAITKKEACNILNISYNTTRLNNIIEQYETVQFHRKKLIAKKRGKPASPEEIANIAESFLAGTSLSDISKEVYRSVAFVKNVINKVGVPARPQGEDRLEVQFLPEECVSESFDIGEVAWSAKYHTSCEVLAKLDKFTYEGKYGACYRVWIREPTETPQSFGGFNAYVPAYDLGSLKHIEGLDANNI